MTIINKIEFYLTEKNIGIDTYSSIIDMIGTAFPDNIVEIKSFESKYVEGWLDRLEFEEDGPSFEDLDEEFENEGNKTKWV